MEHQHRRPTRGIALVTLFLTTLAAQPRTQAQETPPPEPPPPQGYAPPQQVYTVDVYEQPQYPQQPYQPEARAARPRRVVVPYEDGMPIPEGGFVRTVSRKGLWIPGLAIFAASYFVTAGVGSLVQAVRDDTSNGLAWVPVVGGYLIADHPEGRRAAVFSILAQSAGLTMMIAGLSIRRRQLVYYTDSGRGLVFGAAPLRGGAMLSLNVF
ncbi:MAG: hypothetical protein R3B40_21710 [Polyangiales bacterium]|nr:hypothetical protein [Myxococcales bacterium]MCB9660398.1 hypothetical protein [Sandaracinaceae bacterium]